ncbi:MAG: cell envelope biogenesis protein OmpA [Sulfurimonas sp.]|nr:MAG: cell envelope biogenesis protein OmpA [Sulfurimonas sp.]
MQPISVENAPKGVSKTVKNLVVDLKVDIFDNDNDGVEDDNDICPDTAKDIIVNERGCEFDDDTDGVVNSKDKCQDTSTDFEVDEYGCPQTATIHVNFQVNESKISLSIINDLKIFADFLKNNKAYHVIIYGYTDTSGEEDDNIRLSNERANTVKEALIVHGISDIRLTAIGMGSKNPITDNSTYEKRSQNRRVEVELLN